MILWKVEDVKVSMLILLDYIIDCHIMRCCCKRIKCKETDARRPCSFNQYVSDLLFQLAFFRQDQLGLSNNNNDSEILSSHKRQNYTYWQMY